MRTEQSPIEKSNQSSLLVGLALCSGILLGGGLMYLLDPRTGTRRRAIAKDRVKSLVRRGTKQSFKTLRHVTNKMTGILAEATNAICSEGSSSDKKILDRVRSTLGRTIEHPHAVDIAVHDGRVILRGQLRPHEVGQVISAVKKTPGVTSVDNQILDGSATPQEMQQH